MLDSLNKYGLPVKYGIIGLAGAVIAVCIATVFGINHGGVYTLLGLSIGGVLGGWIRQKRGMTR